MAICSAVETRSTVDNDWNSQLEHQISDLTIRGDMLQLVQRSTVDMQTIIWLSVHARSQLSNHEWMVDNF